MNKVWMFSVVLSSAGIFAQGEPAPNSTEDIITNLEKIGYMKWCSEPDAFELRYREVFEDPRLLNEAIEVSQAFLEDGKVCLFIKMQPVAKPDDKPQER